MFDPGWQGAQVKGIEDEDTQDHGNDPVGVIDRYVATMHWLLGAICQLAAA